MILTGYDVGIRDFGWLRCGDLLCCLATMWRSAIVTGYDVEIRDCGCYFSQHALDLFARFLFGSVCVVRLLSQIAGISIRNIRESTITRPL